MALFEKIIQKLFPKEEAVTVHEVLKRSASFIRSFDEWKSAGSLPAFRGKFLRSYNQKLTSKHPELDIEIYRSPYANGFILYPDHATDELPATFLMEYIRERLEEEGYRLVHADRKLTEKGKEVYSLEKYYLKPPLSPDIPIDQLFGNVIVELSFRNNKPSKFKMIVNIYSDRLYQKPRQFEDLIYLLFEKRTSS